MGARTSVDLLTEINPRTPSCRRGAQWCPAKEQTCCVLRHGRWSRLIPLASDMYMAVRIHDLLGAGLALIRPDPLQTWGFVLCAALIVLVCVVLPIAIFAKARPASELTPAAATELFANAIAALLKVAPLERRHIPHIIDGVSEIRSNGALADAETDESLGSPRYVKERLLDADEVVHAAFTISEWPDGSGPTGASPPLLARIVAVAEAWGALTAADGPRLSHEEALYEIRSWAGTRYDPAVIDAAARVVGRERRFTSIPAFQPRLHRLRPSAKTSAYAKLLFLGGGLYVRDGSAPSGITTMTPSATKRETASGRQR